MLFQVWCLLPGTDDYAAYNGGFESLEAARECVAWLNVPYAVIVPVLP